MQRDEFWPFSDLLDQLCDPCAAKKEEKTREYAVSAPATAPRAESPTDSDTDDGDILQYAPAAAGWSSASNAGPSAVKRDVNDSMDEEEPAVAEVEADLQEQASDDGVSATKVHVPERVRKQRRFFSCQMSQGSVENKNQHLTEWLDRLIRMYPFSESLNTAKRIREVEFKEAAARKVIQRLQRLPYEVTLAHLKDIRKWPVRSASIISQVSWRLASRTPFPNAGE